MCGSLIWFDVRGRAPTKLLGLAFPIFSMQVRVRRLISIGRAPKFTRDWEISDSTTDARRIDLLTETTNVSFHIYMY